METPVRFNISEDVSLADRPLHIKVEGLIPRQQVTLRAKRTTENPNILLESYGEYEADQNGVVDLQTQAPIRGTYEEVDGMGLFWSMKFTEASCSTQSFDTSPLSPMVFTLTVHSDDQILATATVERIWVLPTIQRLPVRENGIVATYFHHKINEPRPGIIVLGGSEGGLDEHVAALLASHGYATLALAYYSMEGLPSEIVNIPLEYVESAIKWFVAQTGVNDWVAMHGTSKGGELALLSASLFPEIKSVVCVASGGVVFHGIQANSSEKLPPAWTYHGNPIPYASEENPYRSGRLKPPTSKIMSYRPWYDAHLSNESVVRQATVSVERIQGSILFISGEQDQMLDSVRVSSLSMERLRDFNHQYTYEHLIYPDAGHSIKLPYRLSTIHTHIPRVGETMLDGGGAMSANVRASEDSWKRILRFFEKESKKGRR